MEIFYYIYNVLQMRASVLIGATQMNNRMNNSYIEINTEMLGENIRSLSAHLNGAMLIPVLKDNAYGLGLTEIARFLLTFDEIGPLAVSHVSEAEQLRNAGILSDILVISSALPFQLEYAVANGITLACSRPEMCFELSEISKRLGKRARIQIKINTGLNRIGFLPGKELDDFISSFKAVKDHIAIDGVFSHFQSASSYESCKSQYDLFLSGISQLEAAGLNLPMKHISSSASFELFPEFNMDAVRLGRAMYMDHPLQPAGMVREIASWRSYVCTISHRSAGTVLGYGGHMTLDKDSDVAVIGVGYGDGLDPALADVHAPVLINGVRCPLLVCSMDQSLVDITGVKCSVGDEVTLYGYDAMGNLLSSQAQALLIGNDEGCGLTSKLSDRVSRIYK